MGTYYGLGIAGTIEAQARKPMSEEQWRALLVDRFDLELFDVTSNDSAFKAALKKEIFSENISSFFKALQQMTGCKNVDLYFNEYGTKMENYPKDEMLYFLPDLEGNRIRVFIRSVLLFTEGKVIAEEFAIEPKLINWLFRHVKLDNKLTGAVVSGIVG